MGANIAADSLSSREKIRWFKDEVQPGDLVSNEKYYYLEMFPGIACQAEKLRTALAQWSAAGMLMACRGDRNGLRF
ncbi:MULTISPECIES: hypothetical protein [unclassified Pseudomonas]|jgi:hypothetical protein|uniref:hypothetical protein n=1 Tax=unclassified Pseudomonas TaxID=196821 RepID=UPI000C846A98|nr:MULTISPECIES: hypothetical protein [unclassified Pseudomonas]MDX9669241.1 hypothetical protein [Pseudomonas sp. P8_250]WPN36716.1 hypothetical protein QMK53_03425 [Pseudomonas sp. P8_139]WPN41483.1 hypothetical protein QMK55_27960 [Pseudomonas sp. P8_229]